MELPQLLFEFIKVCPYISLGTDNIVMHDTNLNLRMSGPFELTLKNIDNQIRGRSPGIIALGKVGQRF